MDDLVYSVKWRNSSFNPNAYATALELCLFYINPSK